MFYYEHFSGITHKNKNFTHLEKSQHQMCRRTSLHPLDKIFSKTLFIFIFMCNSSKMLIMKQKVLESRKGKLSLHISFNKIKGGMAGDVLILYSESYISNKIMRNFEK